MEEIVEVQLETIHVPGEIEVGITAGPENANFMKINTGTAWFSFRPPAGKNRATGRLTFPVTRVRAASFQNAIVWGAPAKLRNAGGSNNAGWAVDEIDADYDDETRQILVTAKLFVSDTDGFLEGLAFQVTTIFARH